MYFDFFPLRFEFIARQSLFFPPGQAANILRGALGITFRRIACVPDCQDARTCQSRASCPYAQVFEPIAQTPGPSGLADWPRPFVFRARHLDGRAIRSGESFYFDLHVFSLDPGVLSDFIATFAALARDGLGPGRGKADLRKVRRLSVADLPEQTLYENSTKTIAGSIQPVSLDLRPGLVAVGNLRVEFLSPTELKHDHKVTYRPEFPVLFARVRDRISTLRALYGAGGLDIDFQASQSAAAAVKMTHCSVRKIDAERRSTKTGQTHSIGGFVGSAEYEGNLTGFLPFLQVAQWTGVGRQAVWGKGEIAINVPPDRQTHLLEGFTTSSSAKSSLQKPR